ncbi:putative protamine p1 [Erysiphe necator]|uniref:Putative protamine p1 n=1 Tax=Uncinula necator TaxID=52586 RepID=A0A0B1PER2_UNCNE|nr:putative protamine p1 [Erysiphe necator]
MYTTKAHNVYDDEPFHFTPIFDPADIICEGSDTDQTPEQVKQKHLRYEAHAERCASGRLPVLQSTVLRRSLTSSWVNPWRCKPIKAFDEKRWQQSFPEKLVSNNGIDLRKTASSISDYLSPDDTISWCRTSGRDREDEADRSVADTEIFLVGTDRLDLIQLSQERCKGNFSHTRNKKLCEKVMEDHDLSFDNNDVIANRTKRGVKRQRRSLKSKRLRTTNFSNWDTESCSSHESFPNIVVKGKSKNRGFKNELPEQPSPLKFNHQKMLDSQKLFINSKSSSFSSSSSSLSIPKRPRKRYKVETHKGKYLEAGSDDYNSENSNSTSQNRKVSIYAAIRKNRINAPQINRTLPPTSLISPRSMDQDSFMTKISHSSRAIDKFTYKKKKRKRDWNCFNDVPDQSSQDSNYLLERKKKKIRVTKENQKDLLMKPVDIQRAWPKNSGNSGFSLVKTNPTFDCSVLTMRKPFKNSSKDNLSHVQDDFHSGSDLIEDIIAWGQEFNTESSPFISQEKKGHSQLNSDNDWELILQTTPRSNSRELESSSIFSTPGEKKCRSPFRQRLIQKTWTHQENSPKSSSQEFIVESSNKAGGSLLDSLTPLSPQESQIEKSFFSTSPSNIISKKIKSKDSSYNSTFTESNQAIEAPPLFIIPGPETSIQKKSSPETQFLTPKMPDSSGVTSPSRNRASRLSLNRDNSTSQILNVSPCINRLSNIDKCIKSPIPKIIDNNKFIENLNISFPHGGGKDFCDVQDDKQMPNLCQDKYIRYTGTSSEENQALQSPIIDRTETKMSDTYFDSTITNTEHSVIMNPILKNTKFLESDCTINDNSKPKFGTSNLKGDKPLNSNCQSPWAFETPNLSINFDRLKKLSDSALSFPSLKIANTFVSPHSSNIVEKIDFELPKINFNITPENKVSSLPSFNTTEKSHLSSQNDILKSYESAMKNPWKSSFKKSSAVRSKKRVSFQQSKWEVESLTEKHYASSPETPIRSFSQPDQMTDPSSLLLHERSNNLLAEKIPNLTNLKYSNNSEVNLSPGFSAMAEAFIAADKQTYGEKEGEEKDRISLSTHQLFVKSDVNDDNHDENDENDTGQSTMPMKTTINSPKGSNNVEDINDFAHSIGVIDDDHNDQQQQPNCWLDSPSIAPLRDIDFSVLAADNNNFDTLLCGVEDILEDWSVDKLLK